MKKLKKGTLLETVSLVIEAPLLTHEILTVKGKLKTSNALVIQKEVN